MCMVSTLACEHARLVEIFCSIESVDYDLAHRIWACEMIASEHTPTAPEGWIFFIDVLASGGADYAGRTRIATMLRHYHRELSAAARGRQTLDSIN